MSGYVQKYDGNQYNLRGYTPGHLFKDGLEVSLCGFRFGRMAAVLYDQNPQKVCKKCQVLKEKEK